MQKLSKKTKTTFAILGLLVCIGLYAADTISKNPFIRIPTLFWKDYSQSNEVRTIKIAGREFDIPVGYFETKPNKNNPKDSFYIRVVWPEMWGIYQLPDRAIYREMFEQKKIGGILVEASAKRPLLDEQVLSIRRSLIKEEKQHEDKKDVEKLLWFRGTKENPELNYTVYLEKNSKGQITTFILCRTKVTTPFPGCDHKFINNGLIYEISYNMNNFLSDWPLQRQKAINLVDSFEAKSQK